jgi:hypothetical protein
VSGSIAAEVAGGQLGTVMETGFVDALDPLSADASAKLNQTLTDLSGFTSTFEGLGAELGARFSNALVGAFQGVTVGVTAALNGVLALLGILNLSFYARGISLGTSLGQGLIDGVNSKLAQAYAAGAGVAAQAEAGARDTSKSHSPSQVFDDIGQDLVAGLVRGVKNSMSQSTSVMAQAINQMADAGSPQPLADSISAVFNTLIYRINNAFLLLAGRLGVSEIFAGSPVRQFAQGVVATSPTFGRFAEAGPEAILPLGDGAAAARIIAQLVPYIGAQGRAAAADLLGLSDSSPGRADGAGGSTWHNEWNVTVPTDDPELFARRAAARLERRMTR